MTIGIGIGIGIGIDTVIPNSPIENLHYLTDYTGFTDTKFMTKQGEKNPKLLHIKLVSSVLRSQVRLDSNG